MTHKESNQIDNCKDYCRINYLTKYSKGSYIIKMDFYLLKEKKLKKLMKDCIYINVIPYYKVTLGDIVNSAIVRIEDHIQVLNQRISDYIRRFGEHDEWTIELKEELKEVLRVYERVKRKEVVV